jgi:hypothetical protein
MCLPTCPTYDQAILSEMRRVLDGVYIEELDRLAKALKTDLTTRLQKITNLAAAEFVQSSEYIRKGLEAGLPASNAIHRSTRRNDHTGSGASGGRSPRRTYFGV